ncbi:MAG: sulfur carrier protein ThiS [Acidobacteriota bacterium]|nr:sulfur carrier protein ThiS [Acidobacteriota bacterium]
MKVFINGETREIESSLNLRELLQKFDLPSERIAVELNREVVRKKDWETIEIRDADKIEIVHFVGGG